MKIVALCAVALAAVASPCAAVTAITFANVPGAVGTAVTAYTENGYTYTATGGALSAQRIVNTATLGTTSTATVDLTYSGGTFQLLTLGGYAQAAGAGSGNISFIGYLNGASVFNGNLPLNTAIGVVTIATPHVTVDRIAFTLNRGTADSVVFSYSTATPAAATALPEPASWAMMLLGFGGLGYAMRRRQTAPARIRFV